MQHQHKFTPRTLRASGQPGHKLVGSNGSDFFKLFGQLAADGDHARGKRSHGLGERLNAVRRFHDNDGLRLSLQYRHRLVTLARLARQKACEHKT